MFHGLVLHHGTKDVASRWKVDGARSISLMLSQKVVNGERGIDFRMNGPKGVHGALERLNIGEDTFSGHVEMMEMSGLRFSEKCLHVQQTRHFVVPLIQRVSKGPGSTRRKQTKTKDDEAH